MLAAALGLRLWSIGHGLPFAYNTDEELHFVPRAVAMFGGSLNPGYFDNPPALTYLLHLLFRARFATPFGSGDITSRFADDPEPFFLTARVLVAGVGALVAGLVYWAGTRFWDRRVGLAASALMAFAFLPVFYSKQALNDVVVLAPLTAGLVACLAVHERGRPLHWALAGAALGAATATKYTAGAMVVCLGLAALFRVRDGRSSIPQAARGLAGAALAFTLVFLVLNPYAVLDFEEFKDAVGDQAATAGEVTKLGQDDVPAPLYYLWTLTWGLGWVPALAALAGGALALRAHPRKALLLLAFPVVLFAFLSLQSRFFGRWLLPLYPALAILAGYAAVRAVERIPMRASLRPLALAAAVLLLAGEGLVASVRSSATLAEEDTRALARAWLLDNVPPGSRLAIEPLIPEGYLDHGRGTAPYDPFPLERLPPLDPPMRIGEVESFERRLDPVLVDLYAREGYCWVVVSSYQKDRGLKAGLENARGYYDRLAARSAKPVVFSPYRLDADPVEFNFDLSFNYLPRAYERPGPRIELYRLRNCGPA